MSDPASPSTLLLGALLLGAGLYLIQRGRFLVPALMSRSAWLRRHIRWARALVIVLLTLGILAAGLGCRLLLIGGQGG